MWSSAKSSGGPRKYYDEYSNNNYRYDRKPIKHLYYPLIKVRRKIVKKNAFVKPDFTLFGIFLINLDK